MCTRNEDENFGNNICEKNIWDKNYGNHGE